MLDNLRGMAVFASVVNQGSFSGAAKELGITTSAVSQQIRTLESDLGIVLLHRSTRKLSLTEAGADYYDSAKVVVEAAEKGRIRITQLRDELAGVLRISTTPELALNHVFPALSSWIVTHKELSITFFADNNYVDMIDERIDVAIRMSRKIEDDNLSALPLAKVRQILVASPNYIKEHGEIKEPKNLKEHQLISISVMPEPNQLNFVNKKTSKKTRVKMESKFSANNVLLALKLAKKGHGVLKVMSIDAQAALESGDLVEVLPEYQLPTFELYAVTIDREQQPAKVTGCLKVLEKYWENNTII